MEGEPKRMESAEAMLQSSDVAVNPETGVAVVVIKPDAFARRDMIVRRLEGAGLYVVSKVDRNLPESFVLGAMYPDLGEGLKEQTVQHFSEGPSEVLLIRGGEDLVRKLVEVTGTHTNPAECTEDTVRNLFGEHFAREASDGASYYRNAVHRAKNSEEQRSDLEKFRNL